ncbi:helix-turn-helix transcriptional regulator [Paenibacillus sp. YPG26]|uniref:helix-turn-helix transcriptional regulator n=1 Tax=Paenibacillus sp. YPG26 TaxID=2878915 RepID=UPI0020417881|nr:helix-turn-helix transcriptional regulator [Paenibacillus sp. YPG26]USB33137.1 helix-turn-helix transcriptional regulator [Paenibacillus sp. YPG26]
MSKLTTVELVLLQIIAETERLSGYEINKLIDQRGYRAWTKIGTTSIYTGLQKLNEKRLIRSEDLGGKMGKGPLPVKFTITEDGRQIMQGEVMDCLSSTRERDIRFDLGLAALPFIPKEKAKEALRERHHFLSNTSLQLEEKYEAQGGQGLPLHVRVLFLHPLSLIEKELQFIDHVIHELEGEMEG